MADRLGVGDGVDCALGDVGGDARVRLAAAETEEAEPLWTPIDAIPFERMWADDQHWLHRMLTGKEDFVGRFLFDGDTMLWHEIDWTKA